MEGQLTASDMQPLVMTVPGGERFLYLLWRRSPSRPGPPEVDYGRGAVLVTAPSGTRGSGGHQGKAPGLEEKRRALPADTLCVLRPARTVAPFLYRGLHIR